MREVAVLAAIAFAVHALVLALVFPGYYDPLWPHHSDFYIPAAFANGTELPGDYPIPPRPVGVLLLYAAGHLGIRGAIAFTLAVTFVNCAVTATAVRRILGDALDARFVLAYGVYLFLLFTQPHFYTFYTHDALSQYAYALALPAAWFAFRYAATGRLRHLAGIAAFALLSFLCKETYGPVALVLAAAYAAAAWKRRGARAALAPAVAIAVTLAVAFAANVLAGFPLSRDPVSAYQVVLAPASVATQWLRFAGEALNPFSAAVVLLAALATGIAGGWRGRRFGLALVLPLAALASWIGNAALPHHHIPGYSWNGAYLMFAPVLALAPLVRAAPIAALAAGAAWALAIASPLLDAADYRSNGWSLDQEATQRRLLGAIGDLARTTPAGARGQHILVTGLSFPFSPFDYGAALASFPRLRDARFDVVTYPFAAAPMPATRRLGPNVRFVPRQRVDVASYDAIWAFFADGTLFAVLPPAEAVRRIGPRGPFGATDVLVFPELARLFGPPGRTAPIAVGHAYLLCGARFLEYEALDRAEKCLAVSEQVSAANPYPFFYMGAVHEKRGDLAGAKREFERAVARDDPRQPNPAFSAALARVDRALGATPGRQPGGTR